MPPLRGRCACACTVFRTNAARVPKSDFDRIEYLLRQGKKQLKVATMPGVTAFNFELPRDTVATAAGGVGGGNGRGSGT